METKVRNMDPLSWPNGKVFGFFTDISDDHWKHAQEIHAKSFPNFFGNHQVSLKGGAEWYAENFQEEFHHCPLSRRIPSNSYPDGPKWVCDPHRIAAQDRCLIYSFGCFENGEFKTLLDNLGVTFHDWGIGTQVQAENYARTGEGPPLYTLKATMAMLNHTGREIDILKIDCEACEWEVYPQFLGSGMFRQILVETHDSPMPAARDFFFQLHDAGYVIFSKEANYLWGGNGVEYSFLKLHRDFFIDNTMYFTVGHQS